MLIIAIPPIFRLSAGVLRYKVLQPGMVESSSGGSNNSDNGNGKGKTTKVCWVVVL
jgi:hypothetical protein